MDRRREILQLCDALSFNLLARKRFEEAIEKSEVDWLTLVSVANENLLTPALYAAMRDYEWFTKIGDEELESFLREIYQRNRDRNRGIVEQLADIQAILSPSDIEPLILKGGAVLLERLYPDEGVRMMNDLDIMIDPRKFDEGLALLKEGGYEEFGRNLGRWHHHTPRIHKKGFPAAVEPHFRAVFDREIEYIPYNDETAMSSTRPGFERTFVLRPTWHLFHTFLHTAVIDKNHQRWRLGLRYLYDFVVLARTYKGRTDWGKLRELAEHYGHGKILQDFLYLGERLFGLKTPLRTHRLRGEWFLKKCLWQTTLEPNTRTYKFYEAYTDFHEIYGYEKLKHYYGLKSKIEYPFALARYMLYHGKKHLVGE